MAGRGPAPGAGAKDPSQRRRRNKPRDGTVLPAAGRPGADVSPLPYRYRVGTTETGRPATAVYLRSTREWYQAFTSSPEATQFSAMDLLYLRDFVAPLVDQYGRCPSVKVLGELRLQLTQFGATPDAKKRQGWTVGDPEPAPSPDQGGGRFGHLRAVV